ncbi:MAG: lipopolysaccharide biosynthesis protein [Oscillospiraceae bacterium]|nr:lipopolysaccharide biosynthesis protein [Oscillospiraceae bacterium]
MSNMDERNVNIILKNQEESDKEEVIISFSAFVTQLKRFLIFWLTAALLIGILVPVFLAVFTADQHKKLDALISFNYPGIEKGLSPDGSAFDINAVKNPNVIKKALTELGIPLTSLEEIRQGITFEGIVPSDAIDRITVYKSPYDQGNIKAADAILETTYYPTQFRVIFDYSLAGLEGNQPVEVFHSILKYYGDDFLETYGFNDAVGSAVTALDYQTYDYPEQIDVFDTSLDSMQRYISSLASSDSTRFRSTVTGYTFADLSQAIQTIRDTDLTMLSSEILMNNVTKNKPALVDYYTHRIEVLTREVAVAQSELNAINQAIESYQLGTVIIYGESGQGGAQYNTNSEEYDKLFDKKVSATTTLSSKQERLKDYQKRLNMLKAQTDAANVQVERIAKEMDALNAKVTELINKTNATANEYYSTVYLSNSYNILVPPNSSGLTVTKSIIRSAVEPLVIIEALLFVIYFGYAFIYSIILENKKRKADKESEGSGELSAVTTEKKQPA